MCFNLQQFAYLQVDFCIFTEGRLSKSAGAEKYTAQPMVICRVFLEGLDLQCGHPEEADI